MGSFLAREHSRLDAADSHGWRAFFIAIGALAAALGLALFSSAATETGRLWLAGVSALAALGVAGWVAFTIVPVLARRTPLRWMSVHIDYRFTREGVVCVAGILVLALAAVNTGNNLLFMILASLLASILISGVVSQAMLSGVEVRVELPEHIFAGQPVVALVELINHKQTLPSFSLRLVSGTKKSKKGKRKTEPGASSEILARPVYFPYLPRRQAAQQSVEMQFPRRGLYRQEALGLQTRFPFGFLQKTRAIESQIAAVVYPAVEPTQEFYEILPLVSGELESFLRGRGHDLYSIRDYQSTDSARHVDWKASAKSGNLQVREFASEDERRVLLALDPFLPAGAPADPGDIAFNHGVSLCASLAWHFYQMDSVLAFRTAGMETPMAPAGEVIYDILSHLAVAAPRPAESGHSFLEELAALPQVFKIVLTAQPRGSIPNSLWNTSYVLFLDRNREMQIPGGSR
jgi:uncharacterized protein (DUF58 family)